MYQSSPFLLCLYQEVISKKFRQLQTDDVIVKREEVESPLVSGHICGGGGTNRSNTPHSHWSQRLKYKVKQVAHHQRSPAPPAPPHTHRTGQHKAGSAGQYISPQIWNRSKQQRTKTGNTFCGVKMILYLLYFPAALSALATSGTRWNPEWNTPELTSYTHCSNSDINMENAGQGIMEKFWFLGCWQVSAEALTPRRLN